MRQRGPGFVELLGREREADPRSGPASTSEDPAHSGPGSDAQLRPGVDRQLLTTKRSGRSTPVARSVVGLVGGIHTAGAFRAPCASPTVGMWSREQGVARCSRDRACSKQPPPGAELFHHRFSRPACAAGFRSCACFIEVWLAIRSESIRGILNGTCNFVLSRMEGLDFDA